ncbi:MAG TPA: hypothetical protein GXX14_09330, partial [Clostridiaceae bacterium]|nr:hypothetical protein [Clostridiaceae bacterium]
MTREERVLRTIRRESIDYLPSNIYFASPETKENLRKVMNFETTKDLDDYLENHLYITAMMDDIFRYRGDHEFLRKMEQTPFAKVDWEKGILYDRWGVGFSIYTDGINMIHFPLKGKSNEEIDNYQVPDIHIPGNFDLAEEELKKYSGDYLVVFSGYGGIFERAMFLMDYEQLLILMAWEPKLCENLFDKITEYKIEQAKMAVKMGFKIGHACDDLGTQNGPLISKEMFRKYFKPRWKKVFEIFKSAGMPVMMHSCGNITEFLPDLIDIGLDVIEPVQPVMDFEFIKKEYGKYLTFWGGIS